MMIKTVDEYLDRLRQELKDCDSALIQDALADAEEHLRTALDQDGFADSDSSEMDAFNSALEKYGLPEEVAAAYREMEERFASPKHIRQSEKQRFPSNYFGVISDQRAWGAFLYMIISCLSGSIYGFWALIGASFSSVSLILIIGVPITGLFLLSIRGIALMEGRIVEALLGVRMPRRPVFVQRNLGAMDKLKALFTESHTWKALIYCVLMFPLGWIYFGIFGLILAFSLSFIFSPLLELVFHIPLDLVGDDAFTPLWLLPMVFLAGIFLIPLMFHLAGLVGKWHGRFAKIMLVNSSAGKENE